MIKLVNESVMNESVKTRSATGKDLKNIKVGDILYHKNFDGKLEVTKIHKLNSNYTKNFGISGIQVKASDGNSYDLWYDTETLRIENRIGEGINKLLIPVNESLEMNESSDDFKVIKTCKVSDLIKKYKDYYVNGYDEEGNEIINQKADKILKTFSPSAKVEILKDGCHSVDDCELYFSKEMEESLEMNEALLKVDQYTFNGGPNRPFSDGSAKGDMSGVNQAIEVYVTDQTGVDENPYAVIVYIADDEDDGPEISKWFKSGKEAIKFAEKLLKETKNASMLDAKKFAKKYGMYCNY